MSPLTAMVAAMIAPFTMIMTALMAVTPRRHEVERRKADRAQNGVDD